MEWNKNYLQVHFERVSFRSADCVWRVAFFHRALARFPTRLYNCVHLLRNTNKTYRRAGARVCEAGEPRAPSLSYSTDRNVVARRSGELCRRSHETPLIYRARERRRAREQKIQLTYTAT